MKTLSLIFLTLLLLNQSIARAEFPEKPITIVVYTAPGGLIDVTARFVANIAKKKYTDVPVIVQNKKGAGGVVATTYTLSKPSDGYTVLGITSSLISKMIKSGQEDKLDQLHFLSRMVVDYESLIVNPKKGLADFSELLQSAQNMPGSQIWVGPDAGGTDHIFAKKFWATANINAKWIPYRSGGEAVAALLGGHGQVYVGNPQDVKGRPDLKVAAVAAPERLDKFPEAPTFAELGFDRLTGESLWRGFAVKADTPDSVVRALEDLLRKVSQDPEWIKFCKNGDVLPVFDVGQEFKQIVYDQREQDRKALM